MDQGTYTYSSLAKKYDNFTAPGFEIQLNVVDQSVLLDAKAHPENHRDLMVRVAGYSD